MIAEVLNKNEFDPHFLGQLIQIVLLGTAILVGFKAMGRRPPMEVALANLANGISTATEKLKDFDNELDNLKSRLNDGDRIMRALQQHQAASEAWREHFSVHIHELKTKTDVILARIPNQKH